nr:hypothetical protein [Rhizobium sp. CF080]
MQQLEAEVGVPLLNRLQQGVGLTAAGEVFLRYARSTRTGLARPKRSRSVVPSYSVR